MLRSYRLQLMEAFNPAADFIDYLFSTIADDAIEQMLQEATEEGEED